jgi:hypothetical protein
MEDLNSSCSGSESEDGSQARNDQDAAEEEFSESDSQQYKSMLVNHHHHHHTNAPCFKRSQNESMS